MQMVLISNDSLTLLENKIIGAMRVRGEETLALPTFQPQFLTMIGYSSGTLEMW